MKDKDKRREYQREYMRGWYQKNKAKHIACVRKRDKKIKAWLKEYKETLKCEECGENYPACLDFHHINPQEKKFSIARINDYLSWGLLKAEIAKCRVLRANCHRKKHYEERKKERGGT
ncbi:MAG: hypothetical protein ACR2N3_14280 [Pyrinomonadaceae bacterium]